MQILSASEVATLGRKTLLCHPGGTDVGGVYHGGGSPHGTSGGEVAPYDMSWSLRSRSSFEVVGSDDSVSSGCEGRAAGAGEKTRQCACDRSIGYCSSTQQVSLCVKKRRGLTIYYITNIIARRRCFFSSVLLDVCLKKMAETLERYWICADCYRYGAWGWMPRYERFLATSRVSEASS